MQLTTFLVLAAASLAQAKSNRDICTDKNPSATNAIGKFCQKTDMVIPSDWAKNGMSGYNGKTIVHGGKHGGSKRNYGNNGCQKWEILYQKDLINGNKRREEGVDAEDGDEEL
ncbi:hypothetical protein LTR56_022787 [Elasticomyces elasticus]|nr:hypothetical protein LTR22_025391 [Elasticomyces elasticus]KAK3621454.1 hypothetical protein LTR56_022787 [Elasticomyces elasticus]KAK4904727.1 hypothetical protein LTR49_025863 [Elasticomyces elasticus]KAK5741240.1 hypothetical protein LTS12_024671 [Elasticomyces elasticus]